LGHSDIMLEEKEPLCISGDISRDEVKEQLVLFHFLAKLKDETDIGTGEWKTVAEVEELESKNMFSSKNIMIALRYFLQNN
jgi:hypothetical protein